MEARLRRLRERFRFDEWRDASRLDASLFVWRFRLDGTELEGWRAHRIQHVELEGQPPANLSVWQPGGGAATAGPGASKAPGALLALDVLECGSGNEAKEQVLRRLGGFQGPAPDRVDGAAPGDVAFLTPGRVLVFARANLAVVLHAAGPPELPVREIGTELDRWLVARGAPPDRPTTVEIVRFEPDRDAPAGEGIPLVAEAVERRGRDVWYKFFPAAGELRLHDGRPTYFPPDEGEHEITLVAVGPEGAAGERKTSVGHSR